MKDWDDTEVHRTHCCVGYCKYCEDDCPVATGKILPAYKCEDCTCLAMNPGAEAKAQEWWNGLSDAAKAQVYLQHTTWYN